jgi:predicted esterase
MIDTYSNSEGLSFDVVRQIIDLLPPPAPPAEMPQGEVDLASEAHGKSKSVEYRLVLPPEYHPHRPFPLLLVLPNTREEPKEALARWRDLAAEQGYIVAVPRWADRLQTEYKFTPQEQDAAFSVLRDVRRRFNVDAERIFLTGYDQAGTLAYDLGMSHPDQFAGVVVICARPSKVTRYYQYNTQYLPFYVVDGERSPINTGENRNLFEYWMSRGFPSLYVEYAGRGLEFFAGELPSIFDWMSRRKRATGLPELGGSSPDGAVGGQFHSLRDTENRFYWISSDRMTFGAGSSARLSAVLTPANNGIRVNMAGYKQMTIWLNTTMVDFEQPVEIRINPGSGAGKVFNKRVQPSLHVLLEDFYLRGDKKNLFLAKVDFEW